MWLKIVVCAALLSFSNAWDHVECLKSGKHKAVCEYMKKYSKRYQHVEEYEMRVKHLTKVADMRKKYGTTFGWTSRSDIFQTEKRLNRKFKNIKKRQSARLKPTDRLKTPRTHDWRDHDRVTTPQDQGDCGDCFAYSAAAAIDYWYAHLKNSHNALVFSAQELGQCTSIDDEPNQYCEGGLMEYIFEYGKDYALPLDSEYDGAVCENGFLTSHISILDYDVQGRDDNPNIEDHIPDLLLKYGVLTVGIDSDNEFIDNYVNGTFDEKFCGQEIDHAVAIVGYTETDYIIKNSWGTDWGEGGFLKLKRGVNACGIAEYIAYITNAKVDHRMKPKTGYVPAIMPEWD